jgi:uncharacterized protein YcfL
MKLNDILFNSTFVKKKKLCVFLVIIVLLNALLLVNCSSKNTNISYQSTTVENNNNTPKLNILFRKSNTAIEVLILYMEETGIADERELMIYWAVILPEKA